MLCANAYAYVTSIRRNEANEKEEEEKEKKKQTQLACKLEPVECGGK